MWSMSSLRFGAVSLVMVSFVALIGRKVQLAACADRVANAAFQWV
jgi:hypothetical protein